MTKRTRALALAAWSLSLGALLPSQAPAAPAARDLCSDRCTQREYECEIGGNDPGFCDAVYQYCLALCS